MIPPGFIQDLLARVDIADVVGRHVTLKKAGVNLKGLCPFHGEKTPSFIVSPTRQTYHCFGCGAHGDALRFLREMAGLGFIEAVEDLAQQAGMAVPQDERTPQERERAAEAKAHQATLADVLARAGDHYRAQLKASPRAVDYLKRRGLSGAIAARFGLGYAPPGWRGLASVFPRYDDPLLEESGLVIATGEDEAQRKRYDRFRDRVMFPIRSVQGDVIGFGGRVIDEGEPKYLNSPETPVFVKGRELYGLYEARTSLRTKGYALVVEGYMDVVALAQLGFPNAVATLGTACTADHVHKLFRFTDAVVFSFDGDAAGRRAAGRALEAALPLATDVRSVRFLFLPPEHDPDSYIREHGTEGFERQVTQAVPLSRQLVDAAADGCDLATPEGRARLLAQARPLWSALPDGGLKRQILGELARAGQLPDAELAAQWSEAPARGGARRADAPGAVPGRGGAHDGAPGGDGAPWDENHPGDDGGRWHDAPPEGGAPRGWRSGDRAGRPFRRRFSGRPGSVPAGAGPGVPVTRGVASRLDRALWLLLQRSDLWDALDGDAHDLLAAQPAPYDAFFGSIERSLHEHGPLAPAALLDELRAQAESGAGQAALARVAAFHDPEPGADLARELAIVLDRLRLQAVEDELTLLFESGSLSPEAQQRGKELVAVQSRLKTSLARATESPAR